jgi:hypothetical protein
VKGIQEIKGDHKLGPEITKKLSGLDHREIISTHSPGSKLKLDVKQQTP